MSGGSSWRWWSRLCRGVFAAAAAGALAGCLSMAPGEASGFANPADQHCIDQQHELVPIFDATGVSVGTLCVNRWNNRRCESWAYYRGECSLGSNKGRVRGVGPELDTGANRPKLDTGKSGPKRSFCNEDGSYMSETEHRFTSRGGCGSGAYGCTNFPDISSVRCRRMKPRY